MIWDFYARPEIKSVEQLKGKLIGTDRPATPVAYGTMVALKKLGLSPKDVQLFPLGSSAQIVSALYGGQVAGGIGAPPASFQLERAGIDRYYNDKSSAMKVIGKYTKEPDNEMLDKSYEFYRKAGFRRDLMISEPGIQGILDFLSETVPEAKKASPGQFFDDRLLRQVNSSK
jgi:hypothetical protein